MNSTTYHGKSRELTDEPLTERICKAMEIIIMDDPVIKEIIHDANEKNLYAEIEVLCATDINHLNNIYQGYFKILDRRYEPNHIHTHIINFDEFSQLTEYEQALQKIEQEICDFIDEVIDEK